MERAVKTMEEIREAAIVRLQHLAASMAAIKRAETNMSVGSDEVRNAWVGWNGSRDEIADAIDAFAPLFTVVHGKVREDALATANQIGTLLARDVIAPIARESETAITFITGNSYMPPLRSLEDAERVYQADTDGDIWHIFYEAVDQTLDNEQILMQCPEHDNALYVVDLTRWEYDEDAEEESEDENDLWVPRHNELA